MSDGYEWPDIQWRIPRVIPHRPVEVRAPVIERRPELGDLRGAGAFLAQSAVWSA